MTIKVTERKNCRACGGSLTSILDLGNQQVINFGDKDPVKAPLHLMKCDSCHLVQLKHTLDQDYLFRKYYYRSNTNSTMRNHLRGIVEEVQKRVKLEREDIVVDIGSNDGTLLSNYPDNLIRVGFDPAKIPSVCDYIRVEEFFSSEAFLSLTKDYFGLEDKRAKAISMIACFYDLDDPNAFLQDIKKVLAPDGLFIIEQNYLPTMLKNNAVDNICHEHLCYYSLRTLDRLLLRNGLSIHDVSFSEINGGVFRVYVHHSKDGAIPIVGDGPIYKIHQSEKELETMKPYQDFANKVRENAYKLGSFVLTRPSMGETVMVYGPSTRGATLMQLAGLADGGLVSGRKGITAIQAAVDRNPEKVGTKYLGIPVISEEQMRQNPPNYLLILPYSFVPEFLQREKPILMSGGAFIIPCPEPWKLQGGSL